jgi:hypothetical protein
MVSRVLTLHTQARRVFVNARVNEELPDLLALWKIGVDTSDNGKLTWPKSRSSHLSGSSVYGNFMSQ